MERPQGVATNCPPGLEYLTKVDQLLVQQQVELLEGDVISSATAMVFLIVENAVVPSSRGSFVIATHEE